MAYKHVEWSNFLTYFLTSQIFREARRTAPCVLYLPHVTTLWAATTDTLKATFLTLLVDLPPLAPVFVLATTDETKTALPILLLNLFSQQMEQVCMTTPYPKLGQDDFDLSILIWDMVIVTTFQLTQE